MTIYKNEHMNNRHKLFFVRDHPRCRKASQIRQAVEFGCGDKDTWIIGTKRKEYRVQDFKIAVVPGDHIGIAHLWLFVEQGPGVKPKARVQLREMVDFLLDKCCTVTETSTGRACSDKANLIRMYDDAVAFLAGRSGQKAGPGAPKVQIYTPAQAQVIADIWHRKDLINSKQRIAAIRARDPAFKRFTETAWYRDVKPMLVKPNK